MGDLASSPDDLRQALGKALADAADRLDAAVRQAQAANAAALLSLAPVRLLPAYPDARVVQFQPPAGAAVVVPAGTPVERADGDPLALRTAAPLALAPVTVRDAEYVSYLPGLPDQIGGRPVRAVLRLVLAGPAEWADGGPPDGLALWFGGAGPAVASPLFEAVHFRLAGAFARPVTGRQWAAVDARAGGLDADETLYPAPDEVRLLSEAGVFADKFYFLRLDRLAPVFQAAGGGPVEVAVAVTCGRGPVRVTAADFVANAVAVVNLGPATVAPVEFTAAAREVVLPGTGEVLTVEAVAELVPGTNDYGPARPPGPGAGFGLAGDRPGYVAGWRPRPGWGYEAVVSRYDPGLTADTPAGALARVDVVRSDGPRAAAMPRGGAVLARTAAGVLDGRVLTGPAGPVPPPALGPVPHPLAGLTDEERAESLRAFVRAAGLAGGRLPPGVPTDPARERPAGRWADAIVGLTVTAPEAAELAVGGGRFGTVRGRTVTVTVDPDGFAGRAPGLFVAALDRCLGLATPRTEFTRLVVRTPQQEEYRCPPRLGSRADL